MTIDTMKESKGSANTSNFSALTNTSTMTKSDQKHQDIDKNKKQDKRSASTLNMKKKLKIAD